MLNFIILLAFGDVIALKTQKFCHIIPEFRTLYFAK